MNQRATTQGAAPLFPLSSTFQYAEKLFDNREEFVTTDDDDNNLPF